MKHITPYLDVISRCAYLAFEKLPEALQGLSYHVGYRPILFAYGQLSPAEIAPKHDWTHRRVLWLAHGHGIPLQMPALHPFNPLPLLPLAVGCGENGLANRSVCKTIFRHVWQGGADAADAARLEALQQALVPRREPGSDALKTELKSSTEQAIAAGLFGVPTCAVDGKLFWGFDALPMLRAYLEGDTWFGAQWDAPAGIASRVAHTR